MTHIQCAKRRVIKGERRERCLRAEGHRLPHIYLTEQPAATIVRLCILLDKAEARIRSLIQRGGGR